MRWRPATLTGWGRSTVATVEAARPERIADLQRSLAEVGPEGAIAYGAGRSYGDAALNPGGRALLTERLDRVLAFNPETGEVVAEPGVTFGEMLRLFLPRGFMLPVTPGTGFATLGGGVATDVHGKNHDWAGSFGDHLLWLDLMLPSGEVVRASPDERPGLFAATIGGIGLTGIVVALAFRMMRVPSPAVAVRQWRVRDLDEMMGLMEEHRQTATFSVAWVDALARGRRLGRGILEVADPAREGASVPPPKPGPTVRRDLPGFVLNPLSIGLFNAFHWRGVPRRGSTRLMHYERYLYPLDGIAGWNRIYGKRGFHQFQAVLPDETSPAGIRALLEAISRHHGASFLSVLKTLGGEGRGLLSFPRRGYTLALDFPRRSGSAALFAVLERLTLDHGGRVYLAKDALLSPAGFAAMYPGLPAFRDLLEEIDPGQRMSSAMARRLGLREPRE